MRPFASQILQTILLASLTASFAYATTPVRHLQGTHTSPTFSPILPRPDFPLPPGGKVTAFSPILPRPDFPLPPGGKVKA